MHVLCFLKDIVKMTVKPQHSPALCQAGMEEITEHAQCQSAVRKGNRLHPKKPQESTTPEQQHYHVCFVTFFYFKILTSHATRKMLFTDGASMVLGQID